MTSAVMDIISVNKLPIPKEKKGKAKMNIYGLPGINKNQSKMYPITETPCERIKALFLPIFFDIHATVGITRKVVTKAPTLPKRVGQIPADSALPANK